MTHSTDIITAFTKQAIQDVYASTKIPPALVSDVVHVLRGTERKMQQLTEGKAA